MFNAHPLAVAVCNFIPGRKTCYATHKQPEDLKASSGRVLAIGEAAVQGGTRNNFFAHMHTWRTRPSCRVDDSARGFLRIGPRRTGLERMHRRCCSLAHYRAVHLGVSGKSRVCAVSDQAILTLLDSIALGSRFTGEGSVVGSRQRRDAVIGRKIASVRTQRIDLEHTQLPRPVEV